MKGHRDAAILIAVALLASLVYGRAATPAAAQIPPGPSSALSLRAFVTVDGHGIALDWSTNIFVLNNDDGFLLFRRPFLIPGIGEPIFRAPITVHNYTDYDLGAVGPYCYQVVSLLRGAFDFVSADVCAGLLVGTARTVSPVLAPGCNVFYQTQPVGTAMTEIARRFDPSAALISIWRLDPTSGAFTAGYFADPYYPSDFVTLPATNEFEYACLNVTAAYR